MFSFLDGIVIEYECSPTHDPSLYAKQRMRCSRCESASRSSSSNQLMRGTRTGKDELLETAMALHEAAMKDEYFIKRKLAPNVDFWWAFGCIQRPSIPC